jgi:hypothetical protein
VTNTKHTTKNLLIKRLEDSTPANIADDLCLDYDAATDAILLPGYVAEEHGADIYYPYATTAREAAEEYVADYDASEETYWAGIRTWRRGYILQDGEAVEIPVHEKTITAAVHPKEPECEDESSHDWQSPHEIVGGIESNPGVWGHGGGVMVTEVCMNCRCGKHTDTWAQDPESGEQGLTSIRYEAGEFSSELEEEEED